MESEQSRAAEVPEVQPGGDLLPLPERLGFYETEELQQLRPFLVEAMASGDAVAVQELGAHYYSLAEEVVNQQTGEAFTRAQIGLQVAMAVMRREAGRVSEYREDIADALLYAAGMGYANVASALESEDLV